MARLNYLKILVVTFFLTYSCGPDCQDNKETFRNYKYDFKITNKYKDGIFLVLEGTNKNGKMEKFEQAAFEKFEKYAEINDFLKKDSGSVEIFLIKTDTIIKDLWWCDEDSL